MTDGPEIIPGVTSLYFLKTNDPEIIPGIYFLKTERPEIILVPGNILSEDNRS